MFSKWYTTVLVDMLHEEKEPIEWMSLHVGAERWVNCEHMQVLLTNLLQKHWERQENRRKDWEPGKFRIQDDVHGKVGREDGVRRSQAVGGVRDSFFHRYPRSRGGDVVGRDARREGIGLI